MATVKQLTYSVRLQGSSDFGDLGTKNFARAVPFEEVTEKTVDVAATDLDVEYSFAGFKLGHAEALFVRVTGNPVVVKINSPTGEILTLPDEGMLMVSGEGVEKIYLSGQPAGDARAFIQAVGS